MGFRGKKMGEDPIFSYLLKVRVPDQRMDATNLREIMYE